MADLVKPGQRPGQDDAIRQAFAQFAPGGQVGPPLRELVPDQTPMDELDQVLARHVTPAILPVPDFAFSPTERQPIQRRGDFWSGFKEGLKETLPGMLFQWHRQRLAVEAALGEIKPEEGYDPFGDSQIEDAGMRDQMYRFSDSRSSQETAFRIRQIEERAANNAALEHGSDAARTGGVLGTFADPALFVAPEVMLPLKAAPRLVWGSLWEGTRLAGLNAGLTLGIEAAKSGIDRSHEVGSILDAIELPALIGFGVGTIRAAMARHASRYGELPPVAPEAPPARPPEGRPAVPPEVTPVMASAPGDDAAKAWGMMGYEHTPTANYDRAGGYWHRDASSAAVRPGMAAQNLSDLLAREALAETGTGIENFGLNPTLRVLQHSRSLTARQLVTELVDLGGLKQRKNRLDATGYAQPTSVPVEADIAREWRTRLIGALSDMQAAWIEGRTGAAAKASSAATDAMKLQARDFWRKDGKLTWGQFDERVARAMRRGDQDAIRDAMTPYVERAAAAARRYFDDLRKAAEDPNVDLFRKTNQKTIDRLTKEIAALKAKEAPQVEIEAATNRLGQALANLGKGPEVKGAQSYFTRLWNVSELSSREGEFISRVARRFEAQGHDPKDAAAIARNIHTTLTRSRFKTFAEEAEDWLSGVGDPMSAHARTFEIADIEIEDFLESSAVLALRHQMANFAPTVELTRRFGDASLEKQLKAIEAEYEALHATAGSTAERTAINRQMRQDLDDLQALRDRLLNIAGASKDPHSWDQRTIRMLKHYMVWTTMGLSAFSQLGDLFRPALTEGLDAINRYGFGTLIDGSRKTILEMSRKERLLSGDALEVVLASKSLAFSDIGDVFASRSNMERLANKTTTMFYTLNGMNFATDLTKDWGATIIQGRINEAILGWSDSLRGGAPRPSRPRNVPQDVPDALFQGSGRADASEAYGRVRHPIAGEASYFSFNERHAASFGPEVSRSTLAETVSNPLMLRNDAEWLALTERAGWEKPNPTLMLSPDMPAMTERLRKVIKDAGHDGLVVWFNKADTLDETRPADRSAYSLHTVFGEPQVVAFGQPRTARAAVDAPDATMMARLRSLGIDGNDALRIAAQLEQHGVPFKSIRMANTDAWTDRGAQELYRQALQRAIQRTIVTPGAGDRPVWMTTPIGSLITQFRTFGMSSMVRTLYAGLQDRDRQFWTGAAVLVGAGVVLNEMRRQLFYEKSSFDQPFLGVLADGLDRSGVLGSLMDANNALEAISNNKLGLRPAVGAAKPWPVTPDRVANSFFGPAAGKAAEAASQLGRLVEGDFTATTWRRMRGFVPGQNLPYVDPIADQVFPSRSK